MMTRRNRHIIHGHNGTRSGFESDLMADSNDDILFETIGDYMKGRMDIEDVKNDPALLNAQESVKEMITDYNKNKPEHKENEKYIREIFADEGSYTRLNEEIKDIKQEIENNKLNDITADWVREWHEKKQNSFSKDAKSEEIKDFITSAISSDENEPVEILNDETHKNSRRNLFVRFATLSAAAILGAFLLLRALLPSSDPEKLFNSYYKPFAALSTVTRSVNNDETNIYSLAIESYKSGDYQKAATGFSSMLEKDPSIISSKFFLGLSQLALKNYDGAVNLLSAAANNSGEYGKEARWYLGLAYLKTSDKEKAIECFTILAGSDGFYRERSEKILRRLK
jgi:TolA-binding protein